MKTSLSTRLLEAVFHTVESLPPASIENVAMVLESEEIPTLEWRSRVLNSVALPQERSMLISLMTDWENDLASPGPILLAVALRSALHTKSAMYQAAQEELVWTGPSSGMTFRRTDQALLQVIQAAKRELLLVTFAAYRVPILVNAIYQAAKRGVSVRFISESAEESEGKVAFDPANAFSALEDNIKFYVWPREKRERDSSGNFGSLHAKCALADDELLLVSSANFTDHALLLNMEIGILVRGGTLPLQVHLHFTHLIQNGCISLA